jgi:hypothetical protein
MHTGVISFCDRVAYNIKSSDTKDDILGDLESFFNIKILQKHWYPLTAESVKQIYRAPHLACLRSNGNPYYMFFTRYEDVPIIFFIDKKVQPGYQKPRIIIGRGMFDESLFNGRGTVMEGEMVKDRNGQWIFLINDVIGIRSQFLRDMPLPKRIELAYSVLKAYTPDPIIDFCTFQVKQYCYATQNGLDFLLEFAEDLPYTTRGIYYWPFFLQYKPKLYNFNESVIKEVHRKVKDNPEFREKATSAPPSPSQPTVAATPQPPILDDDGVVVMWLRKTENPDVYDVYSASNQHTKTGVAHVPSLLLSRKLRQVFKDLTVTMSVAFSCRYSEKFAKYEPIEIVTERT